MSIKGTHDVTRANTLAAIHAKLDSLTDEQISNLLEETIHNGFYNFWIVEEGGLSLLELLNIESNDAQ